MRELAAEEHVPLIDLNRRVLNRWQGKTTEQLKTAYFAGKDTTHFNRTGAQLNAACVTEELRAMPQCPLASFLLVKPAATAP